MKLSWKAVFLGWLSEWLAVFFVLIGFLFGFALLNGGFGKLETWKFDETAAYSYGTLVLGFLCECCGGWVTASIAKKDEIHHALIAGVVSLIFGWAFILSPLTSYELNTHDFIWAILVIPAYIIGAQLRARRGYATKTEPPINQPPIPEP